MALEVTYEYYKDTLERQIVPNAETFDALKLKNLLNVENLIADELIIERKENGYINAVCMMTEIDYITDSGTDITSESIGGYSWSGTKEKKPAEQKHEWLKLYCHITSRIK